VAAPLTLTDLEPLAHAVLDPHWREYFAGGAGTERTLRANLDAFARVRLRQRVLGGIETVSTRTTILGHDVASPVVVAPVGFQRRAHRDGEEGMARAAAATGSAFCLSTFATAEVDAVAAEAREAPQLYQVYVFRDHGVTRDLIARALDAGFAAIVLTVDLPVQGMRDRERRVVWHVPDDVPAVAYANARGLHHEDLLLLDPALDWAYLERLCADVPVPVVVKGVLDPADAVRAAEHGAAAVVVSNHGGRQLDGAPASLEALPPVVDAVGDRLEVLLDGGIRRGTDVAAALAFGARAVLAGRVPLWGLAAGGVDGATFALEALREELGLALHLMGCSDAAEVSRANVLETPA
jgi:isopentenyl diphosphate isomerase/L-lactate dehydrogenase-like FMN-dependent dehydrogenase